LYGTEKTEEEILTDALGKKLSFLKSMLISDIYEHPIGKQFWKERKKVAENEQIIIMVI